jgi:hypothetical protein
VTPVWGPAEGKQLADLLQAAPGLTIEAFQRCLQNRAKSDVAQGMRPSQYLPSILTFQGSPLDQYGKPKAPAAAEPKATYSDPYADFLEQINAPIVRTPYNAAYFETAQEAAQ